MVTGEVPLRPLVDSGAELDDDDVLLRVVQPSYQTQGNLQTNAFQDQTAEQAARWGLGGPCASVAVVRLWRGHCGTLDDLLGAFAAGSRLAQITVGSVRHLTLHEGEPVPHGVMLDPRDGAPWHAVIFTLAGGRRSKGACRALKAAAAWFES